MELKTGIEPEKVAELAKVNKEIVFEATMKPEAPPVHDQRVGNNRPTWIKKHG